MKKGMLSFFEERIIWTRREIRPEVRTLFCVYILVYFWGQNNIFWQK